jgi:hypothetical protein
VKFFRVLMVLALGLTLLLTGCGGGGDTPPAMGGEQGADMPQVAGLIEPIATEPAFLTSVGQSADVQMVKTLLDRAQLEHEFDPVAPADDLTEKYQTLIMVIGGSSKGLGAAGIKPEEEMIRATALVEKARELGQVIITLHVGGEARRGDLSDPFITNMAPAADYLIVVEEGNKDGLFTRIAADNDIPMDTVTSIAGAAEPLQAAFIEE